MFSKTETSAGKQAFWTAFGRYMQPVTGADGLPRKWLNYETGVHGLYIRVLLIGSNAYAGFEISDASGGLGAHQATLLTRTATQLNTHTETDWDWIPVPDRPADSVFLGIQVSGTSPMVQSNWPELISFFKRALLAMDAYWTETGFAFEMLT
ncbi:MAG: DUF4268 domain-containing protein [Sphingobacteriales bacterium]|nr:MAG: DUF4268 domain-containing protein [Sphingobacteriales bacterium]